jgi:site-specific recombinase XerD
MTILVTGGTGLVGSRLLRRFVDAGLDCRALVRPGKEVPAGAMDCSDQTIRAYRSDLKLFNAFLQKYSIHRLDQMDHTIITNFIQHMREVDNPRRSRKGLSDATIGRRLSSLSSYFEYVRATSKAKFRNPLNDLPCNKWKKTEIPNLSTTWSWIS